MLLPRAGQRIDYRCCCGGQGQSIDAAVVDKVMLKGHGECKLVRDAFSDVHERVASQMARRWRQKYKSIEEMAISRRRLS